MKITAMSLACAGTGGFALQVSRIGMQTFAKNALKEAFSERLKQKPFHAADTRTFLEHGVRNFKAGNGIDSLEAWVQCVLGVVEKFYHQFSYGISDAEAHRRCEEILNMLYEVIKESNGVDVNAILPQDSGSEIPFNTYKFLKYENLLSMLADPHLVLAEEDVSNIVAAAENLTDPNLPSQILQKLMPKIQNQTIPMSIKDDVQPELAARLFVIIANADVFKNHREDILEYIVKYLDTLNGDWTRWTRFNTAYITSVCDEAIKCPFKKVEILDTLGESVVQHSSSRGK